jgi:hypothetical protein
MHFFKSPDTLDIQSCQSIFDATTRLLNLILGQETSHALNRACACFVIVAASMGAGLILRILRSPYSSCIDNEHGSTLYLSTIKFLQSCSIVKGDSPDRSATFAEQLWRCDKLFKENDGSRDIALHVRNRLASSATKDMIMRWRDGLRDQAAIAESSGNTGKPARRASILRSTQH